MLASSDSCEMPNSNLIFVERHVLCQKPAQLVCVKIMLYSWMLLNEYQIIRYGDVFMVTMTSVPLL